MRINRIPHTLVEMALVAANGSNRVLAGEYRRSKAQTPINWAQSLVWRATEFKGKWAPFYLVAVAEAGPQPTIDGQVVNNPVATGMWSGCSLVPSFDTEAECQAWIESEGLNCV